MPAAHFMEFALMFSAESHAIRIFIGKRIRTEEKEDFKRAYLLNKIREGK